MHAPFHRACLLLEAGRLRRRLDLQAVKLLQQHAVLQLQALRRRLQRRLRGRSAQQAGGAQKQGGHGAAAAAPRWRGPAPAPAHAAHLALQQRGGALQQLRVLGAQAAGRRGEALVLARQPLVDGRQLRRLGLCQVALLLRRLQVALDVLRSAGRRRGVVLGSGRAIGAAARYKRGGRAAR